MRVAAEEPLDAGECARCGAIGAGQTSWMEMNVFGPGTLSFYWKHTPGDYSVLRFEIDGESNRTCNYSTWHQEANIQITGSGTHSLLWQYTKDGNRWLTERVHFGAAAGVSRLLQNMRAAPLPKDPLWRKLRKC